MPTLAAGNKQLRPLQGPHCYARLRPVHLGFTLIELLVVLAIIAIGTAGVSLSMRDSAQSALARDAQRLAALFDAARTRSRASGVPVLWRTQMQGETQFFVFEGLPGTPLPTQWLNPQTRSLNATPMLLGPEPLIGAQSVALSADSASPNGNGSRLWVSTDGLRPFSVQTSPP